VQNIPDNFYGIYVGIVWKSCRVNNCRAIYLNLMPRYVAWLIVQYMHSS